MGVQVVSTGSYLPDQMPICRRSLGTTLHGSSNEQEFSLVDMSVKDKRPATFASKPLVERFGMDAWMLATSIWW